MGGLLRIRTRLQQTRHDCRPLFCILYAYGQVKRGRLLDTIQRVNVTVFVLEDVLHDVKEAI